MNICIYINLKSCEVHKPTTQVSSALTFSYQKNTYLKFSYIGFFKVPNLDSKHSLHSNFIVVS